MKFILLLIIPLFTSCEKDDKSKNDTNLNDNSNNLLEIVSVSTSGSSNNYTFSVGITSPDTGCDQYADWWEIISEKGDLIYRRILGHSHVNEQPFIRSGAAVAIAEDQVVIIRAHMNNLGYGINAYKGTVSSGLSSTVLENNFALELSESDPQPTNCAF